MASSKVMASSSTSANSDLARQPSTYSLTIGELQGDQSKNFGSMNMDELFRNIYGDNSTNNELINPESNGAAAAAAAATGGGGDGDGDGELNGEGRRGGGISLSREGSFSLRKNVCNKTAEEVWKEINTSTTGGGGGGGCGGDGDERKVRNTGGGGGGDGGQFSEMTLEDFLARAGAVREEDVKYPTVVAPVTGFVIDSPLDGRFHQHQIEGSILGFGNSVEGGRVVGGGGGGGRGKRRAVQEPIDKVAQQRQRRMIKNRESAARSRERKQAYTVELETLVSRLEEENAQLLREQEERVKERYKQLMETLIPVQEKRRPPRVLRRVGSAHW